MDDELPDAQFSPYREDGKDYRLIKSDNATKYHNIIKQPNRKKPFSAKFNPVPGVKKQKHLPGSSSFTAREAAIKYAKYRASKHQLPETLPRAPRNSVVKPVKVTEEVAELDGLPIPNGFGNLRNDLTKVAQKMANLKGKGTPLSAVTVNPQWPSVKKAFNGAVEKTLVPQYVSMARLQLPPTPPPPGPSPLPMATAEREPMWGVGSMICPRPYVFDPAAVAMARALAAGPRVGP